MPQPAKRYALPLDILEVTPETVTERLSYRLRQMVGPSRPWSYQGLSARTGIDVRTLKAYVQGTACPNLVKYKRLLAALGPEVGTELNVMKGWLPRSDSIPPEAVDLVDLRDELAHVTAIVGDVLGVPPSRETGTNATVPDDAFDQGMDDEPVSDSGNAANRDFLTPLGIAQIDARAVAARLSYRLRLMIGPDRRWQLGDVSQQTGIDRRTLQSYLDGTACPNLARFLRLSYLLGPEIGVELAHMIGWEPRFSASQHVRRGDIERLLKALGDARAAVDQILDHARELGCDARLIRSGDHIAAERYDETVIPFKRQR